MNPQLKMQNSQTMGLSPQLVASIRLLQLSAQELEQEVASALEDNPLLEAEAPESAQPLAANEIEQSHAEVVGEAIAAAVVAPDQVLPEATVIADEIDVDDSFQLSESWEQAVKGEGGGDDRDPLDCVAGQEPTLRARIELALSETLDDLRAPLTPVVLAVLAEIDDAGYLRGSLAQLVTDAVPLPMLEAALQLIREVAPAGFGARDLRECLLLQLEDVRAGTAGKTLAEQLVSDHLHELHPRNRGALAAHLGVSDERLRAAMGLIQSLNPKPGLDAEDECAKPVVPDVLISGAPGAWKVSLNPATLPKVRLNTLYERALGSGTLGKALKEKLNEARWMIRGLEMRHDTLLRTTQAIFERQKAFLEVGDVGMQPLTLKEIAAAIEMHESTVSRVTSAKYVATPWGTFELKRFFSVALANGQTEASGVAVRAMIRQLIDAENPAKPLCDGAISAILQRKGVSVARRTVAKYREGMKILSAPDRKAVESLVIAA